MGTDIFGISVSALSTAQFGLATTEHNIANANTPGYTRQVNVAVARSAQLTGAGYVGQGSDVGAIKRIYDEFLSNQVMGEQGQAAHLDSYYAQIQQINNMLADQNAGLSPALQGFFSAANGVANAPDSIATRQTLLSSAQTLASRFQAMNQRLVDINDNINGQIRNSVTNINSYAQQIATLNHNIVVAQAASGGKPANDLLDQRDLLLTQLNKEIKVNVIKQFDGSLNVSMGNGQLLVVGEKPYTVQAVTSLTDPSKLEVASGVQGGPIIRIQQNTIQGGNLGGLLAFRSQSLDTAQNSLGLVATGLAGIFNQQHQLGQDLSGALGGSFFVQATPAIGRSTSNNSTVIPTANFSSFANLTGSDYSLAYDGGKFTLTRLSDNTTTFFAAPSAGGPPPTAPLTTIDVTNSDGLTISIPAGAQAGDNFMIRPTVNGAGSFAVAVTDPAKVAAAAPIRTVSGTVVGGVVTDNNTGTGKISAGTVNMPPPPNPNLQNNVTVSFIDATHYTVTDNSTLPAPTVLAPSTVYDPNAGATLSFNGWTAQITGSPAAGDVFTVSANTNASTDNRNALLLASLQTQKIMSFGTANFQGLYSQMVSQVGNKTRELEVSSKAQNTMVQQSIQAQQGVSGVNLDEEAANLMRYQRAYQAAGKAMQIANTMFDTLLSMGR